MLWVQHMSGSPIRMETNAASMRRWLSATCIGEDLTPDEAVALNEFFEGLNGIECMLFQQSCGASTCDIVRLLHLIECTAFTVHVAMRHVLYEDFPEWNGESTWTIAG